MILTPILVHEIDLKTPTFIYAEDITCVSEEEDENGVYRNYIYFKKHTDLSRIWIKESSIDIYNLLCKLKNPKPKK